jgi:hypothetical protein
LLGDKPTHGQAEQIQLRNAQSLDEGPCMLCHLLNGFGNFPIRAGDAGIVKENDFANLGETIRNGGIRDACMAREFGKRPA